MCRLRNIALGVWQTDGQTDRRTDRQTTDKVIPMCRYASQATQKYEILFRNINFEITDIHYVRLNSDVTLSHSSLVAVASTTGVEVTIFSDLSSIHFWVFGPPKCSSNTSRDSFPHPTSSLSFSKETCLRPRIPKLSLAACLGTCQKMKNQMYSIKVNWSDNGSAAVVNRFISLLTSNSSVMYTSYKSHIQFN